MRKLHAIAISLLLGGAAVAGATAALKTVHLGAAVAASPSARVPDGAIAARREKLAKWSASLRRARAAQPPPLPKRPRFAPVVVPTVPATLETAPPPAPPAAEPTPAATVPQQRVQQPPAAVVVPQTAPLTRSSSSPTTGRDDHGEQSEVGESDERNEGGGDD